MSKVIRRTNLTIVQQESDDHQVAFFTNLSKRRRLGGLEDVYALMRREIAKVISIRKINQIDIFLCTVDDRADWALVHFRVKNVDNIA